MLSWELSIGTAAAMAPGKSDHFTSRLIDAVGGPVFGATVASELHEAAGIDFWSVYRLAPDSVPTMFASGSRRGRDVSGDCFRRYTRSLYRADRTFVPVQRMVRGGGTAMTLWKEAEIPSPHRDEIYRRHGIGERLSVVGSDGDDGLLAVNLYRYQTSGGYLGSEIDAIQSLGRSLMACVRKHIDLLGRAESAPAARVGERLRAHCPALTRRELDVCERIVCGWTYDGIAADLGLTPATVKTYRNRAFERLDIHFRSQLFALVLPPAS